MRKKTASLLIIQTNISEFPCFWHFFFIFHLCYVYFHSLLPHIRMGLQSESVRTVAFAMYFGFFYYISLFRLTGSLKRAWNVVTELVQQVNHAQMRRGQSARMRWNRRGQKTKLGFKILKNWNWKASRLFLCLRALGPNFVFANLINIYVRTFLCYINS